MTHTFRFAPSPTGKLHVGNVRTALINWLAARASGGTFVLRIDDTDQERSKPEYEDAIKRDLEWLGLGWDDTFRQSERMDRYHEARDQLIEKGLLYPCYETPEELDKKRKLQRAQGQPPVYDRSALKLTDAEKAQYEAEGRQPHWRFKLSDQVVKWQDLVRGESTVDLSSVSDPVLIRAGGDYLYTLCSVVDDLDRGISHIVRGEDHVTNSGGQIEIFEALGGQAPTFAHTSLLVGADGQGLSKRLGSLSIESLREAGFEPLAIVAYLAQLGTSRELKPVSTHQDVYEGYSIGAMGRAPARFDDEVLKRYNASLVHTMPYVKAQARLEALGCDLGEGFWNVARENLDTVNDVQGWAQIVRGPVTPHLDPEASSVLQTAAQTLPEQWDAGTWGVWTKTIAEQTGAKGKGLYKPLRLALTGQGHGPDMGALLPLLDRDVVLRRLAGQSA